eukprot:CAMPEP_0180800176 /NCGR_PEP_ID=MMETSP1038_2-20121128/58955_1 /TAXON_ID=632150 /ORGANISM="Azadinium spinosum, Strain 3D9" /LENGTH=228 /DNA_ID=CAMNT_0022839869 /DNA_START=1 /DNA_END=688 /DNA_ORIENTATION=+
MPAATPTGADSSTGDAEMMLRTLRLRDPNIMYILHRCRLSAVYTLQEREAPPIWHKTNSEGPMFLVKRIGSPRYQIIVVGAGNLLDFLYVDSLRPKSEFDFAPHYVFLDAYWICFENERPGLEEALKAGIADLKETPEEPKLVKPQAVSADREFVRRVAKRLRQQQGNSSGLEPTLNKEDLRIAVHMLAYDDSFLDLFMRKLQKASEGGQAEKAPATDTVRKLAKEVL